MLGCPQFPSMRVVTVIANPVREPEIVAIVLYNTWLLFWLYLTTFSSMFGNQITTITAIATAVAAEELIPMKCCLYQRIAFPMPRPLLPQLWHRPYSCRHLEWRCKPH